MILPDSAKQLIRSGTLGHMVTLPRRGGVRVVCVWVGVDGNDLVTAHLNPAQRKLDDVRHDPRVTISFEGSEIRPPGLKEYLVVRGRASIEEGGAPELLQELARVHLGPDVKFPRMDDPPPGVRMRIAVQHIGGVGSRVGSD